MMIAFLLVTSVPTSVWLLPHNAKLKQELATKTSRITELEIELVPFKSFAVAEFGKADTKTLAKVVELLTNHATQLKTVTDRLLQAEASVAKTESALNKLQRRVPPESRVALVALLSTLPKARIEVLCRSFTAEAEDFAKDLRRMFEESKFEVTLKMEHYVQPIYGQWIEVHSLTNAPACALVIQQAFNNWGYPLPGREVGELATNSVRILINDRASQN